MQQFPYICRDYDHFLQNLADFKQKCLELESEISSILAMIYVPLDQKEQIQDYIDAIQDTVPDVHIVGGATAVSIADAELSLDKVTMTFTVFAYSYVEVVPIIWDDQTSRNIGKNFLYYIRNLAQPVAIQFLSAGRNLNLSPFFTEVSNCPPDIVIFGGITDYSEWTEGGVIFSNDLSLDRGLMAVVYRGRRLQVYETNCCGWQLLGKRMTITKMDGPNIVKEIDFQSVRDIMKKYLGIDWNSNFVENKNKFALSVIRHGNTFHRVITKALPDGGAVFSSDFSLGENVYLSFCDKKDLIDDAMRLQKEMRRFSPDALFSVSCISRYIILDDKAEIERQVCHHCAPTCGFYSFGEFVRVNGSIMTASAVMSIVGFRESGSKGDNKRVLPPVQCEDDGSFSDVSKLIKMLRAVSAELESANDRLIQLAHIDRLTDLLNRSESEEVLKKKLKLAHTGNRSFSMIMLDIDAFRVINDSCGHDIGDSVLKNVGLIIKDSISSKVYAGRWGGDEFLIMMPNAKLEAAAELAEIIRLKISEMVLQEVNTRVTISAGVIQVKLEETASEAIKRLSATLMKAKNDLGRDAVYCDIEM